MNNKEITTIALTELYTDEKVPDKDHVVKYDNIDFTDKKDKLCKVHLTTSDGVDHSSLTKKTDFHSWLGYAGTLFFVLAILSLLWNFISSTNNEAEAIPQNVSSEQSVIETKYVTKNIEDIQEGDEVLAYDIRTGETVKSKVTQTVHLKCDHLRYLTIRDDSGAIQTFQTTDTHPFWVNSDRPDQYRKARDSVSEHDVSTNSDIVFEHDNLFVTETGYYVEAKDLKEGDHFIGPSGESSILVKTWRESRPEGIDVYNFKVADNSNYFVVANYADFQNGSEPVLVHNGKKKCGEDVIHVTSEGVALPSNGKYKIPDNYVSNPWRRGSYGTINNGKFEEALRIDPPTPKGKKGPCYSQYHIKNSKDHCSPRPTDSDPGF